MSNCRICEVETQHSYLCTKCNEIYHNQCFFCKGPAITEACPDCMEGKTPLLSKGNHPQNLQKRPFDTQIIGKDTPTMDIPPHKKEEYADLCVQFRAANIKGDGMTLDSIKTKLLKIEDYDPFLDLYDTIFGMVEDRFPKNHTLKSSAKGRSGERQVIFEVFGKVHITISQ